MDKLPTSPPQRHLLVTAYAALLGLLGLTLLLPGSYLIYIGGSWFYAAQGLAFLFISRLVLKQHRRAAAAYTLLLSVIIIWAVWESGYDFWALLPRLWVTPNIGQICLWARGHSNCPVVSSTNYSSSPNLICFVKINFR